MPSIPPASERTAQPRKRPWYLVVALIATSLFGVMSALDGCNRVAYYRGAKVDRFEDGLNVETNRVAVREAVDAYLATLDQERRVMFPLGVADMVLGMAMFLMAAGAMAGRNGARRALTQVVVVRAGLAILSYGITPRVRAADMDLTRSVGAAFLREAESDPAQADKAVAEYNDRLRVMPAVAAGALAFKTVALGIVVLALTRRRTRDFYANAAEE
jgi:hypothetical protein